MIKNSLDLLNQNIAQLESQWGRAPHSVQLLAVSKKQSFEQIREAWQNGQTAFGENYLQEALVKIAAFNTLENSSAKNIYSQELGFRRGANRNEHRSVQIVHEDANEIGNKVENSSAKSIQSIQWHFIGPIQGNKTRGIAENFSWVHSVERANIAKRLNDQRPADLMPLNICIQINISQEKTKSGINPEETLELARFIQSLSRLKLRGLMVIPEYSADFNQQRVPFAQTRQLFEKLNQILEYPLDTLSMGMSDDYSAAIAEGATIVRIGSTLFGNRSE